MYVLCTYCALYLLPAGAQIQSSQLHVDATTVLRIVIFIKISLSSLATWTWPSRSSKTNLGPNSCLTWRRRSWWPWLCASLASSWGSPMWPRFAQASRFQTLFILTLIVMTYFVAQGGIYIFQLMDKYTAVQSLVLLAFCEVGAISWIFGKNSKQTNKQIAATIWD